MIMNEMNNLNSMDVFKVISKNYRPLILSVLFASVLAFGASFLLKEKYKSSAVVYPVNLYQNSEESNTEQLLQYFLSEDVKNELAREFRLYEKYGIDTVSQKGGKALFNYAYSENVVISPTLYESIEINVKDENPALAQQLNSRLIKITNELIRKNKREVILQYLNNAKKVLYSSDSDLDSISQKITKIRTDFNIVDEKQQAKYLSKELVKGGSLSETQQKQSQGLREKGSELKVLNGKIKSILAAYGDMRAQYDKYLMDAQGNIDFIMYVSKPSLPDKRCYPVRWIITAVSGLSVLLFGIVVILIRNRVRNLSN